MADVSLSDLGSSSDPLAGLTAGDYQGYGPGGNISGAGDLFSGSSAALGLGALGFGSMLARGPGSLPPQFGALQSTVPSMSFTGSSLIGQGQGLVGQGQQALGMAQRGELTPEQQAQLKLYSSGLENTSRQMFSSMGRNPDQDTAFLSQQGNIDAQVNAMAQQQIQSTIALGLGEISGGSSLIGQGLGFENAANQALLAAGEAQLKLDTTYSTNLTSAFGAIGKLFGTVLA